ncbi:MAG TPA: hypothetical protein VI299_02660 [Polyangiales bacterium]
MELLKRALPALVVSACVPNLDTDESTVVQTRVLAIQAEPAEVTPNGSNASRYRALIADANGVRVDVPVSWFQCLAQKPLAELGPVSKDCLNTDSGKLVQFADGQDVSGVLPSGACSLFGPNPPLPMAGEPAGRPVDPDQSGGYKLPIVAAVSTEAGQGVTLYEQRIYCGLAGVPPEVSVEFATRYHANANPSISELRVTRASGTSTLAAGQPLELAANERVELELAWPACPLADVCGDDVCGPEETATSCGGDCQPAKGCAGQERFMFYDRLRSELVVQREAMRVAWYASHGTYEDERTGAEAESSDNGTRNAFQAPASALTGTLWMVLRDSRGGVGFRTQPLIVR